MESTKSKALKRFEKRFAKPSKKETSIKQYKTSELSFGFHEGAQDILISKEIAPKDKIKLIQAKIGSITLNFSDFSLMEEASKPKYLITFNQSISALLKAQGHSKNTVILSDQVQPDIDLTEITVIFHSCALQRNDMIGYITKILDSTVFEGKKVFN